MVSLTWYNQRRWWRCDISNDLYKLTMCITYANAKPPHVNAEQKNCDKTVKWKNTKLKTTVNNGCILNTFSSDHKKMNWEMEGRTETERTFGTALQAEKGLSHCQHQFSATILASLSVSATVLTSFSHHPHVPLSLSWHLSLGLCHSPDVSLSVSATVLTSLC